ncbi:MAG: hypothetical protein JSS49_18755 [Planctomycetes bacterium]|nr:hypothetical protein [Planctomycetota bacterium]
MNTEERQRLKTNELGQTVQVVGHRLEEHATKIVAGICGLLLVAAAVTWWSRQSSATSIKAWTRLESAENEKDFGEVADDFKGTVAGRWARLRESELYLQSGLPLLFTDRESALTDLKKAREGFAAAAVNSPPEPAIQERALWGLAQTLEATSDGDTTKAVDAYERLLKELPDTFYKSAATQRIAALKTGGAKDFYEWFAKQNPKPTEARPKDGLKGDLDSMLPPASPSDNPIDLKPNPPNSDAPAGEGAAGDGKDDAKTEPGEPKPEAKPEEPSKPDEKPAEAAPQKKPEESPDKETDKQE